MIAYLRGTVEERSDDSVTLDVNGVGYAVFVSTRTLAALPVRSEPIRLFIREVIREDEHTLYGFASRDDREAFELVLSVNGIGPRTAMNVFDVMTAVETIAAIREGNAAAFARVPGIGRKTAQRILLELQSKVGAVQTFVVQSAIPREGAVGEAIQALIELGASEERAQRAVVESKIELGDSASVADLIRAALRRVNA